MSNELTNIETGELIPINEASPSLPVAYAGIAQRPVTADQRAILLAPIPEEDLDILPTGEVYASQVRYRRILNEAFGPMGWALQPVSPLVFKDNIMYREYALICDGRFVAQAIGEQEYIPNNQRMSYATAAEAAKSNALVRCCKDIGIASECWDRRFTEQFKVEHCETYYDKKKGKTFWRRKDSARAHGAQGEPATAGFRADETRPGTQRQSPDDKATPEQRNALWSGLKRAFGEEEAGQWLRKELDHLNYKKSQELRVRDVVELNRKASEDLMQKQEQPTLVDDEMLDRFEAAQQTGASLQGQREPGEGE